MTTPATASAPYTAEAPSFSTSRRSIAATGIVLMSTKLVVMDSANELIATRRPLTSTSVASAPRPRRLTDAAPLAVESWLLPRVENVPLPTNGWSCEQLLQVGVAGLGDVVGRERDDRRRVLEVRRARDARARHVHRLEVLALVRVRLRERRQRCQARGQAERAAQCQADCALSVAGDSLLILRPPVRDWKNDGHYFARLLSNRK